MKHDFQVDNTSVRLRSSGTGRPLVMIHDLGESTTSFSRLAGAAVAAGRTPVAMDLPGSGYSDSPATNDVAAVLAQLRFVMDDFRDEPVDVLGRGFGGYLALTLAADEPARYRRLVVENPLVPAEHAGSAGRLGLGRTLRGGLTTLRNGRPARNAAGYSLARALVAELGRPDPDWWTRLATIRARTLVVDTAGIPSAGRAGVLAAARVLGADVVRFRPTAVRSGASQRDILAFLTA